MNAFSMGPAEGLARERAAGHPAAGKPRSARLIAQYGEGAAALASGALMVVAWGLGHANHGWSVAVYLLAFAVGGFVKAKEGLHTLFAERDLDVNLLMIVAALGAASIGYWSEGALLIFIFSVSGALESYTMERSRRDLSSLMNVKPETAVRCRDGEETVVPVEQLSVGDLVLVRPGERIPADGVVREGASAVNQASITGESVPVDRSVGDEVFAGTVNGQGALFVEVTQPSESTLVARIIRLVQEAQSEKPASQMFIERFERLYARAILSATLLLILLPPPLFGWTWSETLYKAMVFLVVASPCALVASIMPAMLSAISNSARKGLLFKGGAHLENLARVRVVAFDKTGTLTNGRPVVTDLAAFEGMTETELLLAAASVESLSEHPLAKAIVLRAEAQGLKPERPTSFEALTGWGIRATWRGESWEIGKPAAQRGERWTEEVQSVIDRLERQGKTVTVIRRGQTAVGVVALQDTVREQAKLAVAAIRNMGAEVAMLTGDQERTARAIAKEAGIGLVYSELLPQDKVNVLKDLRRVYGPVAMVGDGVNDTPALATASVGIAMGGAGSDAALETADLVLMNDGIERIAGAIALGRRTRTIVKQNVSFAVAVIACLIAANFVTGIALPLGVVGHEGSTILVILNGLRLLRG
ncbi:heavy metal translocating P-type ATPase [Cohnella sp. REN36]|uniref:heavy metal translocating P-type ATPase n=1 Tax=Cohnella sp. REN36 TaxID=2887347 RepID=UPI001D15D4AF|nr:heavy metal translocating P-type ATPase [Cohnella sp. REN36]MCC3371943.1 cadmium-translocating P-type ATPase [Cohnella sp. REN36]